MKYNKIAFFTLLSAFWAGYSSVHAQFILPEDDYTTHRDIDVIRVENDRVDVTNLRARKNPSTKGELILTWTVNNKKDNLAVVRNNEPISKLSLLQTGKVVSLLDPGTSTFSDNILETGNYYYAVVSYPALKEETVILVGNDNYTTAAIEFTAKDLSSKEDFSQEMVQDISTEILGNKIIRIRWNYGPKPNTTILVYRAISEITDSTKLKNALRIGVVPSTVNYFDDQDSVKGEFFYAATVQSATGLESMQFKPNKNYTTKAIAKGEILSFVVNSLRAFKDNGNVLLTWYDREPRYTSQSIIYRAKNAIVKESDLEGADIVGRVNQDVYQFTDKDVPPGQFYYAVLTQNQQGTVQKEIVSGENSLKEPVITRVSEAATKEKDSDKFIRKEEKDIEIKLIYDVEAVSERNRIIISWKPENETIQKLPKGVSYYHLFRFTEKPQSMNDLTAKNYIAKIPLNEQTFADNPPADGFYYYAVFITTPKGVMPGTLREGDNLVGPVIFKRTYDSQEIPASHYNVRDRDDLDFSFYDDDSRIGSDKLNELLRQTYLRKNYSETVKSLESYRKSSSLKIRARANFYSAISYYNLGKFETALELIMDPSVRKIYKDRSDFWYKQILEKMGK